MSSEPIRPRLRGDSILLPALATAHSPLALVHLPGATLQSLLASVQLPGATTQSPLASSRLLGATVQSPTGHGRAFELPERVRTPDARRP